MLAAAPGWTAVDPCVARADKAKTSQEAIRALTGGSPGSVPFGGPGVKLDWDKDGNCLYVKSAAGGQMSFSCRAEHISSLILSICAQKRDQSAKADTDLQNKKANLISNLTSWPMSLDLVQRYQDFTAENASTDLSKVDEAFEKGLVRHMGDRRDKSGGKEPEPNELDQAAYKAWLSRQNAADEAGLKAKRDALEARARDYEGLLRMNRESARRAAETERKSAEIAAKIKKDADQKAAKESECKYWRDMMAENQCGARSLLTTCTKPAAEIVRLGC